MSDSDKKSLSVLSESDLNIPKAKLENSCLLTAYTKLCNLHQDPYDSSFLVYNRFSLSDNKENNLKGKNKEKLFKNNKEIGFASVPKFLEAKENFQFPHDLDLTRGVLQNRKFVAVGENQDDPVLISDLLTKKLKLTWKKSEISVDLISYIYSYFIDLVKYIFIYSTNKGKSLLV